MERIKELTFESKPSIIFAVPKYAKRFKKFLPLESSESSECCNCIKEENWHTNGCQPTNLKSIGARKAKFYENRYKKRDASSRVQHEMFAKAQEFLDLDENSDKEELTTNFGISKDQLLDSDCSEEWANEAQN